MTPLCRNRSRGYTSRSVSCDRAARPPADGWDGLLSIGVMLALALSRHMGIGRAASPRALKHYAGSRMEMEGDNVREREGGRMREREGGTRGGGEVV